MNSSLQPESFDEFFEEVTGFEPFPWQRRLCQQVLAGGWPQLLDLPTGVGKTSVLLIALFSLASDPSRHARRIALVVDRRIIVDQIDALSRAVGSALRAPEKSGTRAVAERLAALCPDSDDIVRVVHLRGGIPRDDAWIGRPDQPTLIASTVDQVGSRLLFRGYGISESMRPVHAGLLSRDTLYFLDEVHLATAFEETLNELYGRYASWAETPVGRPVQVVAMSATPGATDDRIRFELDDEDRRHPVLKQRLVASRSAELRLVKTKKATDGAVMKANRIRLAEAAAKLAEELTEGGARSIGIILNRVDTARRVAEQLSGVEDSTVVLLTGRMRPFDRTALQSELERTASSWRERGLAEDAPLAFIIATSCIEAGADLDFDALVTEVASLDSLLQRFGRLNRLGLRQHARAFIFAASDQVSDGAADDPVYGAALRHTWHHLERVAGDSRAFEMSPEVIQSPNPDLLPKRVEAPVLFPSYMDMWSETRPAPYPDPDVRLWLHGKREELPDYSVSLVFRGDLPMGQTTSPNAAQAVAEMLDSAPPVAEEAVSVPVYELREWLGDQRAAWLWSADGATPVRPRDVRPGQTVIVSSAHGGLRLGSWNPEAGEACTDVGDLAALRVRRLPRLRMDPDVLPIPLLSGLPIPTATDDPDARADEAEECRKWIRSTSKRTDLEPEWQKLFGLLGDAAQRIDLECCLRWDGALVWHARANPRNQHFDTSTEDSISSFTGLGTSLHEHLRDVEAWAGEFSSRAGLSVQLQEDLRLAGLLHDIGKSDLRFQALLQGGDPVAVAAGVLLAKSKRQSNAAARRRAEQRSQWPRGMRHELISLALLESSPQMKERAHDLDLVRHLVASHHGWCRPWAPFFEDPEPCNVRLEVGGLSIEVDTGAIDTAFLLEVPARFRGLCRRYGWHGLAYLEALLRLGDHRASALPSSRPMEVSR